MSIKNKERLSYLLQQYASGMATKTEISELSAFLQTDQYEGEIKTVLEKMSYEAQGDESYGVEKIDEMIDRILKADTEEAKLIPMRRVRLFQKFAAAAAILICVFGSAYFLLLHSKEKTSIAQLNNVILKNDIAPGGNKALLTLADGTTIILDSAANGKLAQQGSTKVFKIDAGKLSYELAGNSENTVVHFNTISTPRGGQYQVVLPDGSNVWLDAASSLKFPTAFSGKERRVELTGEAYFEVTHKSNQPFKVIANGVEVEDLGTHFNINAYNDEKSIKATLLEGSIRVSVIGETPDDKILIPGQQAKVEDDKMIQVINNIDVGQVIAWKKGLFEFENADLPTIMRQISRWYDVDVIYENKPDNDKFGGGISKNLPLSKVLKLIGKNGVKFKLEGKVLKVTP